MTTLGAALKRKSISKAEPMLPRAMKQREPSATGRTIYEEFRPAEVLKEFRKKNLITFGNLSTQKSLTNLNIEETPMKHSRFDDDHHNTESIQQLLGTKMGSNLPSARTKIEETIRKSIPATSENITSQKESLQSESLAIPDEEKGQLQEKEEREGQEEGQGKEGENYDDYVLGDKIDEEEEEDNKNERKKKYVIDKQMPNLEGYLPKSLSEARMQKLIILNERKKLLQLKEDRQIIQIMQEYKNHKQNVMNQSRKKHESQRILASIPKNTKLQKSCSLPALKPKMEVLVPQVIYEEGQQDKTRRNLLSKGFPKAINVENRLLNSLSSGKLGFGRKKIRTICEQDIYEQEMGELDELKVKLRARGITMDSNKLVKGLVNRKNEFEYQKVIDYPEKRLPSNPIYKKFPL